VNRRRTDVSGRTLRLARYRAKAFAGRSAHEAPGTLDG
jgi:hypothetical protein